MSTQKPTAAVPLPRKTPAPLPKPNGGVASAFADSEPAQTGASSGATSTGQTGGLSGLFSDAPSSTPATAASPISSGPVTPPAPTRPTATGGTKTVPVPPLPPKQRPVVVTPMAPPEFGEVGTKGLSVEEGARRGLKGSQLFGVPPKSGDSQVQENVEQGQTKAAAPAKRPVAVAAKEGGTKETVNIPKGSRPATLRDELGEGGYAQHKRLQEAVKQGAVVVTGQTKDAPEVLAFMQEVDTALLDMSVDGEDEAREYLELTATIPWAELTEPQKYTRQVCFSTVLAAKLARHEMLRAILEGEAPINLSVHIPDYPPAPTAEERDRQTADAKARLGLPADEHGVIPERSDAYEMGQPAEAVVEELPAQADEGWINPDGEDPSEGEDFADDGGEGVPDEGTDYEVEAPGAEAPPEVSAPDFQAPPEQEAPEQEAPEQEAPEQEGPKSEGPKAEAGSGWAALFADDKRPTTSTGIPLTVSAIRPFVESYSKLGHTGRANQEKAKEIEKKLGLSFSQRLNLRAFHEESQNAARERMIDKAVESLLADGLRDYELRQHEKETAAAAGPGAVEQRRVIDDQMALMREECANKAVGCRAKRYSHAKAKGKCFDPKCSCKGRCEQFVPPSGGGPDKSEGHKSEGHKSASGESVFGADTPSGPVSASPEEPEVKAGVTEAAGSPAPLDPNTEALIALSNRAGKLHCKNCHRSANLHAGFKGQVLAGNKGHVEKICDRFVPENDESGEAWAKLIKDAGGTQADAGNKSGVGSAGGSQRAVAGNGPTGDRPAGGPVAAGRQNSDSRDGRVEERLGGSGPTSGTDGGRREGTSWDSRAGEHRAAGGSGPGRSPAAPDAAGTQGGAGRTDAVVHDREGQGPQEVPASEEWPAVAEALTRRVAWLGGTVLDGHYVSPRDIAEEFGDPNMDWWPTPKVDGEPETERRRGEIVGRILKWWTKTYNPEVYDYRSTSYRVVLAAKELSAQIERYATAHKYKGMSPPDAELVKQVNTALVAYLEAHRPLANADDDVDYVTYADTCETWDIEVGTPWAEVKQALAAKPQAAGV